MWKKTFLMMSVAGFIFGFSQASAAADFTGNDGTEATAVEVSNSHEAMIRDVIESELKAIRMRDERAAYDLSSADFREGYDGPHGYMRMIRTEKAPLYNHVHYKLLSEENAGAKFHKVELIDKDGKSAIAMFRMQQDEQGFWRISKMLVLKSAQDPI